MAAQKRKFKKGKETTNRPNAQNQSLKKKTEQEKLFDKNYLTQLGRFIDKIKLQVIKTKGNI